MLINNYREYGTSQNGHMFKEQLNHREVLCLSVNKDKHHGGSI